MTAAPEPVWPGQPRPLGATWDGEGTNFAVFAEGADAVDLALFDQTGVERRLRLPEVTAHTWHGYVPEVGPGQRYGFRVHGAYDPEQGERRNPAKLLLDPYARAVEGMVDWDDSVFGYKVGGDDLHPDDRDSSPHVPRSVVVHDAFPWEADLAPTCPGRTPSSTRPTCAGSPCATPTCPTSGAASRPWARTRSSPTCSAWA